METGVSIRESARGTLVSVRVHPGARRNAIVGVHDGAIKVGLHAPPVDGRANAALVDFFADYLGVPRAAVAIASGTTSRSKVVLIANKTAAEVTELLASKQQI